SNLKEIIDTKPDVVIALGSRPCLPCQRREADQLYPMRKFLAVTLNTLMLYQKAGINAGHSGHPLMRINVAPCAHGILQCEGKYAPSDFSLACFSTGMEFPRERLFADFNDPICGKDTCEPTIGNILI